MENFGTAILISTIAGVSTLIGSAFSLIIRNPSTRLMSFVLGFAGGVMLLVSFMELLPLAIERMGFFPAQVAFIIGIGIMLAVDMLIPHSYGGEDYPEFQKGSPSLLRVGKMVAIGIAIHNFPEGIATFVGALADVKLGVALGVAIAIHNIPEGLAVAAPIIAATNNHKKAFTYSAISGLAEPFGALIAAGLLLPFLTPSILAGTLAIVAGLMVYISLDEVLPAARTFGHEHLTIVGVTVGIAVMALSLNMLK